MQLKDPDLLRERMNTHGYSQRSLAKAIGWSDHSYLGRLLRGQRKTLTPNAAMLIAAYTQTPLTDLFEPRTSADSALPVARQHQAA